jgi:hypothetical protein
MADMRRRSPEPPEVSPQIQLKPGLADEMLRELAPLLAEEGIDVDNIDVPDMETLNRALSRAAERRNMELFSPVGPTRDIAVEALRLIVNAILDGDTVLAGSLLDRVQPESPDNSVATVASCIHHLGTARRLAIRGRHHGSQRTRAAHDAARRALEW